MTKHMGRKIEDDRLEIKRLKRRLQRARKSIQRYIEPGRSLADELIAERREEAQRTTEIEKLRSPVPKKP